MTLVRIPLDTGKDVLAPSIYRRGVWSVTPYTVGNEHSGAHPLPGSVARYRVTHKPSGYVTTGKPLSREAAEQLCRLLGEFYPDFESQCPFRARPDMPRVMRARVARWVARLERFGSI